ncbi:MAG TPA: cadherin-like domain-containing protein, partial [candidate division Zixibacteria bacterium]|nr:cadherin-like domain-containing protein [candidate division Zixibacteria bacterium]
MTNQLSILSGSGGVGIEVLGTTVSFDGTAFGTIGLNGVDGENLEIAFSGVAATQTAVEALIEALQYQSTATVPTGTTGLNLTVTDADGQVSNEVSFSVEVIDDGISFGDTASTREDNDLVVSFADLLSNDVNFGSALTINTVQDAVGGTVQIVGSNVVFTPTPDTNGPASFTYTAGDGVWTSTATVAVTVTPVNDAPVETGVSGDTSTTIQSGAGAQALTGLADATVTDIDSADFDGGFVRIAQTGGTANGTFGLGAGVTSGGDSVFAASESVAVGGVTIGTVSGNGATGAPLQIDLVATATPALVEALLQSLTYDIPTAVETRNFLLTIDDGDGTADGGASAVTAAFAVQVTPNAPVITGLDGVDLAVAFDTLLTQIGINSVATVTDPDDTDFDGGVLTISRTSALSGDFIAGGSVITSGTGDPEEDFFAVGEEVNVNLDRIGTVVSAGQGTDDLVINLDAGATPQRLSDFLQWLNYQSTDPGAHTFDVTISDAPAGPARATSGIASFTVNVDAPLVVTVPGITVTAKDDGVRNPVSGVTIADADSTEISVEISVPADRGTVFLSPQGSALVNGANADITGASLTVSGTIADVNATLATLAVSPIRGVTENFVLTVTASDGSVSIGGPNTDSDTVTIDVLNAPTIENLQGDVLDYTEGDGVRVVDQGIAAQVIDLDSANLDGG